MWADVEAVAFAGAEIPEVAELGTAGSTEGKDTAENAVAVVAGEVDVSCGTETVRTDMAGIGETTAGADNSKLTGIAERDGVNGKTENGKKRRHSLGQVSMLLEIMEGHSKTSHVPAGC